MLIIGRPDALVNAQKEGQNEVETLAFAVWPKNLNAPFSKKFWPPYGPLFVLHSALLCSILSPRKSKERRWPDARGWGGYCPTTIARLPAQWPIRGFRGLYDPGTFSGDGPLSGSAEHLARCAYQPDEHFPRAIDTIARSKIPGGVGNSGGH